MNVKPLLACLLASALAACSGVDSVAGIERGLVQPARRIANALLERKAAAELELMREATEAGRLLREEAARFERAKCHAGLPALRAYAGQSEAQRAAVLADCGLDVEPGRAVLAPP